MQGVLKHLIAWLISAFGPAEINAQCCSLPPNHHISIFAKGISSLHRITGKEHKNMCRILLGLVMDLPVPDGHVSPQIIAVVHALLDFLYLAQFPTHSSTSITCLEDSISHFHNNKDIFINLGICKHFNLPKIHSLIHYGPSIQLFGTTDNYNTEQMEQLHIDFTKDTYWATNHKDEYSQMTLWLEHCKKVRAHRSFVKWWQQSNQGSTPIVKPLGCPHASTQCLKMPQNPAVRVVSFNTLANKHGAIDFQDMLADFIAKLNNPMASGALLSALASDTLIPFHVVSVYHRFKFSDLDGCEIVDSVLVQLEKKDTCGHLIPSQFDTVFVHGSQGVMSGNNGKSFNKGVIPT